MFLIVRKCYSYVVGDFMTTPIVRYKYLSVKNTYVYHKNYIQEYVLTKEYHSIF